MIYLGVFIFLILVSLLFSEPEETDIVGTTLPDKPEKEDNKSYLKPSVVPQYSDSIFGESTDGIYEIPIEYEKAISIVEHEETIKTVEHEKTIENEIEDESEKFRVEIYKQNLEAFIHNGSITVFEETYMSDNGSVNTEIANRIRSGDNVTIYTQSEEGDIHEMLDIPQENESSPMISEEEMVKELIEKNNSTRKKVIMVVAPTNNPLPLPSWHEVEARPQNDDPLEWYKWRKNVLIQKAWTSKFPFLLEHYECIPVNQWVNAWRNRIENVRDYREPIEDIFDDDPYIGTDIERLFKNEEEK